MGGGSGSRVLVPSEYQQFTNVILCIFNIITAVVVVAAGLYLGVGAHTHADVVPRASCVYSAINLWYENRPFSWYDSYSTYYYGVHVKSY